MADQPSPPVQVWIDYADLVVYFPGEGPAVDAYAVDVDPGTLDRWQATIGAYEAVQVEMRALHEAARDAADAAAQTQEAAEHAEWERAYAARIARKVDQDMYLDLVEGEREWYRVDRYRERADPSRTPVYLGSVMHHATCPVMVRLLDARSGRLSRFGDPVRRPVAARLIRSAEVTDCGRCRRHLNQPLTPGGFPYRQHPHRLAGSNPDRQSIGKPGHCEDCASVGHLIAHPQDLGCGDVGCYVDHSETTHDLHGKPITPGDPP